MAKRTKRLSVILPTQRRLIQLYTALLYNAHAKGFLTGSIYTGKSKMLCVPGLNCYSCPGAVGACPLGALQNAVSASGHRAPFYVLGILMLFGLILGRTICGFLCPMGLFQELLHKLPTPKIGKSRVTRALSAVKYILLAVFVLCIPVWFAAAQGLPVPAFCKYICPAGTLEGAVGLLAHPANADLFSMLGALFTHKFVLLILIAAACVFVFRAFCRFLCPLGAIYGLFCRVAIVGVKVDVPSCTNCGLCLNACKMDIRRVGDRECIHCGECIGACPTKAISLRAGRIVLQGSEGNPLAEKKRRARRIAAWCAALAVLAAAWLFFSQPAENQPAAQTIEESPAVGFEVGMTAPDFTVPLYGGGAFTLSEHRGKTVFVNFWATWCGPCVAELPHFDALAQEHPDDVSVVAIHSNLVTQDVNAYLAAYDYRMPFALDETGGVIASFGGSTMLPMTVVIDPHGVITYNAVGSVDADTLGRLLDMSR